MDYLIFLSVLSKALKWNHSSQRFPREFGAVGWDAWCGNIWLWGLMVAHLAVRGVGTSGLSLGIAGIAPLSCWFSNQLRIPSPPVGQCLVLGWSGGFRDCKFINRWWKHPVPQPYISVCIKSRSFSPKKAISVLSPLLGKGGFYSLWINVLILKGNKSMNFYDYFEPSYSTIKILGFV